jgi:hypothetical protein
MINQTASRRITIIICFLSGKEMEYVLAGNLAGVPPDDGLPDQGWRFVP